MKSLKKMADEVYAVNVDKGWYEDDRSFGDLIALLHSEVSEMLEAYRDHGVADATAAHNPNCRCEDWGVQPKPEGVGAEAADVLIRLLDTCRRYDIDIEAEYERKLEYNKTRTHRHGNKKL